MGNRRAGDDTEGVHARLLRPLYELSTSAGRSLNPGDLVKLVAEQAAAVRFGDAAVVYLWDDSTQRLIAVFSNDPRQADEYEPLRPGQGAAGQAILLRQSVVVEDYARYEHAVPWAVDRGLRSVEAIPLMVDSDPIGVLVIRFYSARVTARPDADHILGLLAAQVAPALEAARLYATSTLERAHERALREITQALAENLDERHVLQLAVDYGAQLFKAPYARVWLIEPGGELRCAAARGYIQEKTFTELLAADSVSGYAARHPVANVPDAPNEPGWKFNREFGAQTGLGAYLGAGLWRAGESLGVLEVMRQSGHRFSDVEEQLLVSLANTVAVAVSNARTHAAVEESERVLRSLYEAIGSGVLVFDTDGQILNANDAAKQILGRGGDQLLHMHSRDLTPGLCEDGSPMALEERPALKAALTGQPQRKVILGIARPDGTLRWLLIDAVPLFGPNRTPTRVVSSFIDVTDQKLAQEALHHRDAILQSVTFAAEELLSSPEWEQSIDDVLQRLGEATGVSRVYIVPAAGDDARDGAPHEWTAPGVGPRADLPRGASSLENVGLGRWEPILRSGGIIQGAIGAFPLDEQVVLSAGGVCSLVAVPIFAGSSWWGFVGFDDCAEARDWPASAVEVLRTAAGTLGAAILRRRAEAERLQLVSEQSARAEAEAAQRRLAYLAEVGQILAASLDIETSMQGVADLLVPGLADACLVDIVEPSGATRRIARALHSGMSEDVAGPVVGQVVDTAAPVLKARALSVPLTNRSGVTGVLTWLASRTRAPFAPADLDLAEHVARRCALAIDNARLYREARAAVSLRDEFLSVAAHELKTPMTSLRGYAQLLTREFERGEVTNPERARRAASTIQVQSDKLARLVGQLLDVSRLQSGKLAVELKSSEMTDLLREVIDSTRPQLTDHTLVARLPGELWVWIDPLRIEQVVTNLIDNAIKYSPDGGQIDIALSCNPTSDVAVLTVRDRGIGVPLEHRAHIFDRFYQAHAGGALTSMAGMGLGLYISRQIVELHGGTIDAEFPEDGGTRFVVRLPLTEAGVERVS